MNYYGYEDGYYDEPRKVFELVHKFNDDIRELIKPSIKAELREKDEMIEEIKQKRHETLLENNKLKSDIKELQEHQDKMLEEYREDVLEDIMEALQGEELYGVNFDSSKVKETKTITDIPFNDDVVILSTEKDYSNAYYVEKDCRSLVSKLSLDKESGKVAIFSYNSLSFREMNINESFDEEDTSQYDDYMYEFFLNKEDAEKYKEFLIKEKNEEMSKKNYKYNVIDKNSMTYHKMKN